MNFKKIHSLDSLKKKKKEKKPAKEIFGSHKV